MAVEFAAYAAYYFISSTGENKNQRAIASLERLLEPLLHGFLTGVLAIAFVSASKINFIRIYYFGMFMSMTILAFLHGIIFMPVVLSLLGPATREAYKTE